jgi:hypothetical protein
VIPPRLLDRLPWRVAGVALLAVLTVVYEPSAGGPLQRLLIPIGMAVATGLLVQNAAAVAIGAGALSAIHAAPRSADWIDAIAYPLLALCCAGILAAILLRRFRRHIADTHDARWRHRRPGHRSPPT